MKKKTENSSQGFIERFCSVHERKARLSLILAASVVVLTVGSVCMAAIRSNTEAVLPSENMELNAAEQYLARAAIEASGRESLEFINATESTGESVTEETRATKRGGLTGEHVVDLSDLKSLSDEELVDAILSGKAGVIDRSDIVTDQSQDSKVVHHGATGDAPAPTDTPTPVPTNVPTPTLAPITTVTYELGIDVSGWNREINWSKVRDAGITFAFIRCGGRGYGAAGNTYEDSMFSTNLRNAKAAGIKVGVYFFSQAITPYEALEEASLTLAQLGGASLDLPIVLDWETEYDGEHRTEHLSGDDLYNVILSFCSTISQNGYTPMIYLDGGNINRLGGHLGDVLSRYQLWYAYPYSVYRDGSMYKAGDTVPPRDFSYSYWQYSWWGDVPGISGDVDLNLRILGKTTLYAPEVNVTNEYVTSLAGQDIDLLEGVSATTSQDYEVTSGISYEIRTGAGNTISYDQARKTAGKYSVIYTYNDSFRGTVTASATWTVTEEISPTPGQTAAPAPGEGDVTLTPAPTPSEGGTEETPTPTPEAEDTENTPSPETESLEDTTDNGTADPEAKGDGA